ncbi:MAG: hypothetical protein AAGB48_04505 [Planctomycetota bacterium]
MLVPAIICGVACIVIGVPFTYYWFRISDRWADEDQKRFHPKQEPDRTDPEIRVIGRDDRDGDGGGG